MLILGKIVFWSEEASETSVLPRVANIVRVFIAHFGVKCCIQNQWLLGEDHVVRFLK